MLATGPTDTSAQARHDRDSAHSQKLLALVVGVAVVVFIAWFTWQSIDAGRTRFMEANVQAAIQAGVLDVSLNAILPDGHSPRVMVTDAGRTFYATNFNTYPWLSSDVRKDALAQLNQDPSVPLFKMTGISMMTDYTVIDGDATVQFEVFPGVTKTIVIPISIPATHFKSATGAALTS